MDVGGIKRKVEFVTYDDQSKPEQAVRIYEKLITDDKVDLLLAPWGTPFHISIAPVLEKYKFPMVGNTAASVALRQVKPGYIWFPTSAIPDRIARRAGGDAEAEQRQVGGRRLPTCCRSPRRSRTSSSRS